MLLQRPERRDKENLRSRLSQGGVKAELWKISRCSDAEESRYFMKQDVCNLLPHFFRLIIRTTSTIWQQAAPAVNRRRLPCDIRTVPVTRPRWWQ